jgi:Cd2+/Zn2+-exporting ATPase
MVASLSAAARLGVLVKSVADLEVARNLTAMIFDKTGTLTTGQLQVTRLAPGPGVGGADLLRAAAAAEQHSKHPVAKAVLEVARRAHLVLPATSRFEEVPGRGVIAGVSPELLVVGRANWLLETHARDLKPGAAEAIGAANNSPEIEGLSVLFVLRDGALLGWIGLEDNTRPEAAAAIDQLKAQGLRRVIIVTGDRESVAKRVAGQMHAEYRAVVGDGVNDAPALAAGDISIAMGAAGSDVAIHSANIALMNNNLNRIPFLIDLSRRTSNVIRQNLAFGVVFIVVGETAAAAGWLPWLWLAPALHLASGLVVVFNSARLVRAGEQIEAAEAQARTPRPTAAAPAPSATPAPSVAPAGA